MVFWILVKIGDQVFRAVLDTGATLSIVARRLLRTFRKTKTVAIRVGDGRTIHSLGGVDVTICLGDETVTQHCRVLDTDAFDIVIGTDFLRRNPQVKMLSLQRPYSLHCDFGSGLFSVPSELSGRKESGLRYAAKTNLKVLPWVVVGAGGLGAGKTSGAGTRGVSLDVVIGGRTGDTDTNGGESSDNRSKVHADCGPAENPSL